MPKAWSEASIVNVRVGNGSLSVTFSRADGKDVFRVENNTGLDIVVQNRDVVVEYELVYRKLINWT
jgi:hypothetical protein